MIGDIRKFRFWCQKVLPLVYDDSLSYYEVLCKVVNYLNHVIDDVNSIPEYIDGVIDEKLSDEHLQELIEQFVLNIESAISSNNEGDNTNSSADYNIGQMLWWNGKLYKVIRQIDAGDTFIVDTNITLVNFEDLFNDFLAEVKDDITSNDDGGSPTATQNWTAGTWLWLNDVLYIVKSNIAEGNAYVFSGNNANVEQINIEGELAKESTARQNADNTLLDAINDEVQARQDADDAINNTIGDLNDLTTTDKDSLVDAINEVNQTGGGAIALIGDLDDLLTTNKDNLVDAINEVASEVAHGIIITPEMFGAVGDGVTDDTAAINAMYQNAANKICVFSKTYLVDGHTSNTTSDIDFYSAGIQVTSNTKTYFASDSSVKMKTSNTATSSVFTLIGLENVEIHGAVIIGDYDTHQQISGTTDEWCHGVTAYACKNLLIDNATVSDCFGDGIYIGQFPYYGGTIPSDNHSRNVRLQNINIKHCGRNGITIGECDGYVIDNVVIDDVARTAPMAGIDVEQEGDYSPIVKNGFIQNITAKNCGSDSIKVCLVTGGATYIQNVFGAQQIYLQSNTVNTYILNVNTPIFVAQCGAEIRNSTINPVKLDTTSTVRIDNCRITWASGSVIANLFVTNSIITNCRGYKNQIRFNNCMFLYPGSFSYIVWLEDGYTYAEFIGCTFNYGAYTSGHSWIYEEADTGQLIVMNCHAQGSGSPTFTYAVNNRGTGDMINGNAYKPYTNMSNAAPATGCVNIDA